MFTVLRKIKPFLFIFQRWPMGNDSNKMQVEFHNRANEKFFVVWQAFENATSNVSRRTEEYRYQQLKKQYTTTLEQELRLVAKEILMQYRNEGRVTLIDPAFQQFIKDYLHRFIQKVNNL